MIIRELIPWGVLTRAGIPPLKVARRPMVLGPVIVPVGETLDPELFPLQIRKSRLRQFYEQRLLEPLDPPRDSRQFYRDQLAENITPISPVASQIVAGLPGVEVPVPDLDGPAKRKKGAK